ncbi:MAG: hypothetical protein J0I12_17660 [Candidatus Eremiobacteraeota bacterium]|nr:hypothetical protein [Candidatus Eremiobacteraeota bacterium]
MRRFLAAAAVAFGLVGFFVAMAGVFGPHLHHVMAPAIEPSSTADYCGDWESETLHVDLHISSPGQQKLNVTGLDTSTVTFSRAADNQAFHEDGGERQMRCKYEHLSLTLADDKEYGFRKRQ